MSTLASVILRDVIGSRPAASIAGRLFVSTDESKLYRDNGASWDEISIAANLLLTTKGDLLVYGASAERLAVGTDGDVLTAASAEAAGVKWAPPSGGVIGTANFCTSTGAITKAHYGGVISSVTYTNTGRFTVNLSPAQTDFSVSLCAQETGGAGVTIYLPGAASIDFSASTSSFPIVVLNSSLGAYLNPPQVTVTIAKL